MNQSQDTCLSQEEYLERLLQGQHQYQQKFQNRSSENSKINENRNVKSGDSSSINNESLFVGRSSNPQFSSGNHGVNNTPTMAFSNTMGIGMNQQQQLQQQQQNRMIKFLQGRQQQQRQQQQQLMTGSLMGGSSDMPSNLGIAGLPSSVGNGIGSGLSQNWIDGLNIGAPLPSTVAGNGVSLYPTEQDLFMSTQRFPLVGNTIGANRLAMNGKNNGSLTDNPLASLLGGLSPYCVPQNLASAQATLNSQQTSSSKSYGDMLLTKQALMQAAQAHLPRTIRLPCGARGMKADHNSSVSS